MTQRSPHAPHFHILVVGIDVFRHKNLQKTAALIGHGVGFTVVPSKSTPEGLLGQSDSSNLKVMSAPQLFRRLRLVINMLVALMTTPVSVVEIYPYGTITLIYWAIARLFRKPVIIIARGLEHQIESRRIRGTRLWSLTVVYRNASLVVYNELYMKELLAGPLKVTRLEFIPNSVEAGEFVQDQTVEGCRFLYLNSLKSFRHPETVLDAFLQVCARRNFGQGASTKLRIVGLRSGDGFRGNCDRETKLLRMVEGKSVPVEILPWTEDVEQHYRWANVFVLPSDLVFLNYALLEAMARGLPVIVQDTDGTERIVTSGVEGFIVGPSPEAWVAPIMKLIDDVASRVEMGSAARSKIQREFSSMASSDEWYRCYKLASVPRDGVH